MGESIRGGRPDHGGDVLSAACAAGRAPSEILDFSANLNPLGPPPWLRGLIAAQVSGLAAYPDPASREFTAAAVRRYGCPASEVVPSSGATEILWLLPPVLARRGLARLVLPVPCYAEYLAPFQRAGFDCRLVPLDPATDFAPDSGAIARALGESPASSGPGVVLLGRPNNPTGRGLPEADIRALAAEFPDWLFVIDEAFADLAGFESIARGGRPANVLIVVSLTKTYAVPGLRVGLALAEPGLAAELRAAQPTWSVSGLAQAVGARALDDPDFARRSAQAVAELRGGLIRDLAALGCVTPLPGDANFLLLRAPHADRLAETLLTRHGIAVRRCASFPGFAEAGGEYLRVAVRTREENARLVDGLSDVLGTPLSLAPRRRRTPALMVLGASSSAGKSLVAAGLCRIFARQGVEVAPFKAQNMSLNSAVTPRGEEIGRAQALQATACLRAPDARMNPVLLKPTGALGSQVVVMGKPWKTLKAVDYYRAKPELWGTIKGAYDELAAEAGLVILEGAGSPAEVNLKAHDVVNTAMARHAGASCLLVADIDRGGAFASLVGTMECLEEWERALIGGFVLNKFRGDPRLLGDAFEQVTGRTGKPFLGVVPFAPDHGLPEEDSVAFKARPSGLPPDLPSGVLDVACLDSPSLSNLTDLDALACEPDVAVRLVRRADELGRPDLLVLPGGKNTAGDMAWLRETGLDAAIRRYVDAGGRVVGVCAGFQLLGERLADPLGLESLESLSGGDGVACLGLLPVVTELRPEKTLRLTRLLDAGTGQIVEGYEIHHGVTRLLPGGEHRARTDFFTRLSSESGGADGLTSCASEDGRVLGCYLHGLFDADNFRRSFLDGLRKAKGLGGLAPLFRTGPLARYDVNRALDRFADLLEASLDMAAIRRLVRL